MLEILSLHLCLHGGREERSQLASAADGGGTTCARRTKHAAKTTEAVADWTEKRVSESGTKACTVAIGCSSSRAWRCGPSAEGAQGWVSVLPSTTGLATIAPFESA